MKKIVLCLFSICFYIIVTAQVPSYGRVVIDSSGEPVAGATLFQKGGKTVVTDLQGNFPLSFFKGLGNIHITAVGFELRVIAPNFLHPGVIIGLHSKDIVLKEVNVSTGYQTLPKERATGSFETVNSKLLNRSVGTDLLSRLEGVTSSIFFSHSNGTRSLFIRGLSTLNASTDPLIILDNFPYEGTLDNIDPDNIESITILKDAAASSIWGAKAGNGVIVITTKKGRFNQALTLHVDQSITIKDKPNIYSKRDFIAAEDFIGIEKFLFTKGFYNFDLSNKRTYPVVSPVVELLARQRAGLVPGNQVDQQLAAYNGLDYRKDYLKYLYQTALSDQHHLSVSGGSSSIHYLMGVGFDRTSGALVGNSGDRENLNLELGVRPLRRLEVQAAITYTISSNTTNGLDHVVPGPSKPFLYPYAQLADDNGHAMAVVKDRRYGYVDTTGAGYLLDWRYRPLDEVKNNDNTQVMHDLQIRLGMKYDFSKYVNLEVKGEFEQSNQVFNNYHNLQTYYTRNIINRFTQRVGNTLILNVPLGGILDRTYSNLGSEGLRGQLNYNGPQGRLWQWAGLAGAEIRQVDARDQSNRTYGYDPNILSFSSVNFTTRYTLWDKLGSGSIERATDFNNTLNHYVSYFANGSLTYRHHYILSASVRKDASNLFGVNTNQKWNPFWSAGGAWKLSDESFYHLAWLPVLKARITYGYSGNIIPGLSGKPIINYGFDPTISQPYALAVNPANADLRWEKTGTLNYGLDFSTRKERFSGSLDFYIKKSKDLFSYVPLDPTVGLSLVMLNSANLTSSGFNLKLSALWIDKSFKWQTDLLMDHVHNRVTRYLNEYSIKGGYVGFGSTITPITGKDPYALISFKWAGLDSLTGAARGYLNGAVSKQYSDLTDPASFDDLSVKGPTRPTYFGSIRNTFQYKGFSLSANISYGVGFYFRKTSINYNSLFYGWAMNSDYYKRWQKPGDELVTQVPAMSYPSDYYADYFYAYSEATVLKGDYVRMQDVQLSYDFSQSRIKKSFLKHWQVYAYINNLGMIWEANKEHIDPEYTYYGTPPKTYSFGIKTIF